MSRGVIPLLLGIAASLASAINIVNTINTLVNAIHGLLFPPGPPIDFQNQATEIASIQAHVLDPTYGLQAIQALIVANQTALLAAIGTPQQAGSAVTLPTVPPTGYGSTDPAAIAADVWAFPGPTTAQPAVDLLEDAAVLAINIAAWQAEVTSDLAAGWTYYPLVNINNPPNPGGDILPLDFSTAIAADTDAVVWLNRVFGGIQFFDGGGGAPFVFGSDGNLYGVPWLNVPTFEILRDQALNLGKVRVPPVWPGVANVTLGSTTALTNGLMLTGPMDGVIVAILSAPPGKAKYAYGLINAYQHIAALSFTDDDGHQEGFEPIQFENQIYVPKSMVTAAGVIFRVDPAVTGTVTPWTNN